MKRQAIKRISSLSLACVMTVGAVLPTAYVPTVQAADDAAETVSYTNPIISGYAPDPSICKGADGYYLINSSFAMFPGIPVYYSQDMVNWKLVSYAMNHTKDENFDLGNTGINAGLWAPAIRYDENTGTYYVITINKNGKVFQITSTKTPQDMDSWTDPVTLTTSVVPEVPQSQQSKNKYNGFYEGIDPDLFFDSDGKVYFTYATVPNGVSMICYEVDLETGVCTEPFLVWGGLTDGFEEGPHIYQKDGYYYLMLAEGGTWEKHMATIARVKDTGNGFRASVEAADGQWEMPPVYSGMYGPSKKLIKVEYTTTDDKTAGHNPLVNNGEAEISATGHADMVQDENGNWWLVCLGRRAEPTPDLARETYLAPVTWTADGWPVVNNGELLTQDMEGPALEPVVWDEDPVRDDFTGSELGLQWNYLRQPESDTLSLTANEGYATLYTKDDTIDQNAKPSYIGMRQRDKEMEFTASVDFTPSNAKEIAGVTVMNDDKNNLEFGIMQGDTEGTRQLVVSRTYDEKGNKVGVTRTMAAVDIPATGAVQLRISCIDGQYVFSYAADGTGEYQELYSAPCEDVINFIQFNGVYLGLYASGRGENTLTPAKFDWVDYEALENGGTRPAVDKLLLPLDRSKSDAVVNLTPNGDRTVAAVSLDGKVLETSQYSMEDNQLTVSKETFAELEVDADHTLAVVFDDGAVVATVISLTDSSTETPPVQENSELVKVEGEAFIPGESASKGPNALKAETKLDATYVTNVYDQAYLTYAVTLDEDVQVREITVLAACNETEQNAETNPATMKVYVDSTDSEPIATVNIGYTGSWNTFQEFTAAADAAIPAGEHKIILVASKPKMIYPKAYNIDSFALLGGLQAAEPIRIEAENFDAAQSTSNNANNHLGTEAGGTGMAVNFTYNGSVIVYPDIDLGSGTHDTVTVNVACNPNLNTAGMASIEVYLDDTNSAPVGTIGIQSSGSWSAYAEFSGSVNFGGATGTHTIILKTIRTGTGNVCNIDYIDFTQAGGAVPEPEVNLQLTSDDHVTLRVGQTSQIEADITPASAAEQGMTYTSGSDAVTVSDTGLIEAVQPTTEPVTITVASKADPAKTATVTVTVLDTVEVTSITLPESAIVEQGIGYQPKVVLAPETATAADVKWEVTEGADVVKVLDAEAGILVGTQTGTATVQATSLKNPAVSDTMTITVQNTKSQETVEYTNPILGGFAPDPSICTGPDGYYLANSSFNMYPGIPVYYSADMVNWELVSYAAHDMDLKTTGVNGGLWAPTIRYHDGTFYMIVYNHALNKTTSEVRYFYTTSTNPKDPDSWSDMKPVTGVQENNGIGIDPDLFFDEDGKVYLSHVYQAGEGGSDPSEFCAYEIDLETGVCTNRFEIWRGISENSEEGPHLYRVGDYYYCLLAEGGTGTKDGHMASIARRPVSEGLGNGPEDWEVCPIWLGTPAASKYPALKENAAIYGEAASSSVPHNPVINSAADAEIGTTGHADFLQDLEGNWWMACLGRRNDAPDLGRETYLMPMEWVDGWPLVNGGNPITSTMTGPKLATYQEPVDKSYVDEFDSEELDLRWNQILNPQEGRYSLTANPGSLTLYPVDKTIDENANSAYIAARQITKDMVFTTKVDFAPATDTEVAGVALYNKNTYNVEFVVMQDGTGRKLVVNTTKDVDKVGVHEDVATAELPDTGAIWLQVECKNGNYIFRYSTDGTQYEEVYRNSAFTLLNKVGYNGMYVGLYASGRGTTGTSPAVFDFAQYQTSANAQVPTTHSVTYTLTNVQAMGPVTVADGANLTATLTAAAGYELPETITVTMGSAAAEFTYDKESGTVTVANVTGAVVITAEGVQVEEPVTMHTVTFNTNGGSNIKSVQVEDGKPVAKPADPTKSGYTFAGWYTDEELTTAYDFNDEVTGDITLYAKWTENSSSSGSSTTTRYTITVTQAAGGKITPSTTSVTKGSDKTFTITANEGYKIADVLVDGKSVGAVSTYTFKNVTAKHTITAKFEKDESGATDHFTDVKTGDWFYDAVEYVVENGLMNGVAPDQFAPQKETTRGMIVTILYREAGSPAVKSDDASWWSDARVWAMEEGISDGTNMDDTITREQLAAMLYRYSGSPAVTGTITGFDDVAEISDWASDAMLWAVQNGILSGNGSKLNPQGDAARAEVATMLMRFIEKTA